MSEPRDPRPERARGAGLGGATDMCPGTLTTDRRSPGVVTSERLERGVVTRAVALDRAPESELLAVSYVVTGKVRIQGSLETIVGEPGSLLIWPESIPAVCEALEPAHRFLFTFRLAEVLTGPVVDARACCLAVSRETGLGPMLSGFFAGLTQRFDDLTAAHRLAATSMAAELIGRALAAARIDAGVAPADLLLTRMLDYVEGHLGDASLCPESIAAAHGISLRYVHLLFSRRGLKVAAWIRSRRLERCRQAMDVAPASVRLAAVAAQWGFPDAAHFSRLFSAAYGLPPSAYRHGARSVLAP